MALEQLFTSKCICLWLNVYDARLWSAIKRVTRSDQQTQHCPIDFPEISRTPRADVARIVISYAYEWVRRRARIRPTRALLLAGTTGITTKLAIQSRTNRPSRACGSQWKSIQQSCPNRWPQSDVICPTGWHGQNACSWPEGEVAACVEVGLLLRGKLTFNSSNLPSAPNYHFSFDFIVDSV
jgi:hypothetical protein